MKRTISIIMAMVTIISANVCFAQSAKDAVRALQKLQARVESGIAYRDYGLALGDARFEVNLFLQSPQAKNEKLKASIRRAMEHYQMARTVWQVKFDKMYLGRLESVSNFIFIDDKDDKELIDLQSLFKGYPGLRNEIKKGPIGRNIHIGTAIQIIWTEADRELNAAIALLSQN